MDDKFEIRLLGDFVVTSGRVVEFPTQKTALLLALLASENGARVSRDRIKGLFWGDRSEEQASGSIRRALSDLRKALGVHATALTSSTWWIALDLDDMIVDLNHFSSLVKQTDVVSMRQAALAYRGSFLKGTIAKDPTLEHWIRVERERLHSVASGLAESLAIAATTEGDLEATEAIGRVLLDSDPACEEAHRALILFYQKSGRSNAAIKQFAICAEELNATLGVEPEERTRALLGSPAPAIAPRYPADSGPLQTGSDPGGGRPSIAVIPFEVRGDDTEGFFVAEGLSEEVQTELSRLQDFTVVSSQSTHLLRDQSSTEIHRLLGVTYLIRGAVQYSSKTVRATGQLVRAIDGTQLWAFRHEVPTGHAMEIIDRIAGGIMDRLDPQLRTQEYRRALRLRPEDMGCWELFHRGMWHAIQGGRENLDLAEMYFGQACERCPDYPAPVAGLAMLKMRRLTSGEGNADPGLLNEAVEIGARALALDPNDYVSLTIHANALAFAGQAQEALDHIAEALDLNPNYAMAHYAKSRVLFYMGDYAEAVAAMDEAIDRSPRDPQMSAFLAGKAGSLYGQKRFEEMLATARAAVRTHAPIFWSNLLVALAALNLDDLEQAQSALTEICKKFPDFSRKSTDALVNQLPEDFKMRFNADLAKLGIA